MGSPEPHPRVRGHGSDPDPQAVTSQLLDWLVLSLGGHSVSSPPDAGGDLMKSLARWAPQPKVTWAMCSTEAIDGLERSMSWVHLLGWIGSLSWKASPCVWPPSVADGIGGALGRWLRLNRAPPTNKTLRRVESSQ